MKYNERNEEVETLRKAIMPKKMKIDQMIDNQLKIANWELEARKLIQKSRSEQEKNYLCILMLKLFDFHDILFDVRLKLLLYFVHVYILYLSLMCLHHPQKIFPFSRHDPEI